jgi:biotin carboxyl carrier protein
LISAKRRTLRKMALEKVEAPIPGKILSVDVTVGSKVVEEDTILCILESMKMENPIVAPVNGTVKEVKVAPGQTVQAGAVLVVIEY